LVLALVLIIALEVQIDLSPIRGPIQSAATSALGRGVALDGPVALVPAFSPTIEVKGLRIANPEGWPGTKDFARIEYALLQLDFLALLRRRLQIAKMTATGVDIHLETTREGVQNWIFAAAKKPPDKAPKPADTASPQTYAFVEVDELSLQRVALSHNHLASGETVELTLDEVRGLAAADEALELSITGTFQRQPYSLRLTGGSGIDLVRAEQPWPLELSLEVAGATLQLTGKIDDPLRGEGIELAFSLRGDRLEDLEPLVAATLPPIGAYDLNARLTEAKEVFNLSELHGTIGKTNIAGALEVSLAEGRPRLEGQISVPILDAGPLLAVDEEAVTERSPAKSEGQGKPLSLDALGLIDAEIHLTVGQVINAPAEIRDATLTVTIEDGTLTAPATVTFAGVAFRGNLELKPVEGTPGLTMGLAADQADLGPLAKVLLGVGGLEGSIDRLELNASGGGQDLDEFLKTLDLRFKVKDADLTYGNEAGGNRVRLVLEGANIDLVPGEDMSVTAQGILLGEAFSVSFTGGGLETLMQAVPWPVRLTANGAGARVRLEGSIARPAAPGTTDLVLELAGDRLGELSSWIGVAPSAALAYGISGKLNVTDDAWRFRSMKARIGKTNLSGEVGRKDLAEKPVFVAALQGDTIDIAELATILEPEKPAAEDAAAAGIRLDMPLLPEQVEIMDLDVDITVKRLALRLFDIEDITLSCSVRDGWMESSPFQAAIGDTPFTGNLAIDLRGKTPEIVFLLESQKADIGALLQTLQVSEGLEAFADRLELQLTVRGSRLREILTQSELIAGIENGEWTLRDPNTQATLKIDIVKSETRVLPGKPISQEIQGRIEETPVQIKIETDRLVGFTDSRDALPFRVNVEAAEARLGLSGNLPLPVSQRALNLEMSLEGERLDSLNELLEIELPALGPYTFGGRFRLRDEGYRLSDLEVRVGESLLTGTLSLETTGVRPRLNVDLTTSTLQINDFDLGDWSPVERNAADPNTAREIELRLERRELPEQPAFLLSPEVMRTFDAELSLKVNEVLSGEDPLGSGSVRVTLEDGRFALAPLELNIPGGSMLMNVVYDPTETGILAELSTQIERFDYGVLARRVNPETEMDGWFSLDIDLKSRAKTHEALMPNANGHFDFAVWPGNFEAGIFDLWAVNVMSSVMPKLDSEPASMVNCLVGRFNLSRGRMWNEILLIDTSRIRALGGGEINFRNREIEFYFQPRAKKAQFFSLATAVQVKGSFSDFGFGAQPEEIAKTAIQFLTSPIHTPFRLVLEDTLPADGQAACKEAMKRREE
jgi:uncharacterized protein involved in outer membrane biogenesis